MKTPNYWYEDPIYYEGIHDDDSEEIDDDVDVLYDKDWGKWIPPIRTTYTRRLY